MQQVSDDNDGDDSDDSNRNGNSKLINIPVY